MKRLLVVVNQSPYQNNHVAELFDEALVAAVFEFEVSVLFLGEGTWCLQPNQRSDTLGVRSIENMMKGFETYDITNVFVCNDSISSRHIENPVINATSVPPTQIYKLLQQQDFVVTI